MSTLSRDLIFVLRHLDFGLIFIMWLLCWIYKRLFERGKPNATFNNECHRIPPGQSTTQIQHFLRDGVFNLPIRILNLGKALESYKLSMYSEKSPDQFLEYFYI
jgi:hypothetical protein